MPAKAAANFSIWADMLARDSSTEDGGLETDIAASSGWECVAVAMMSGSVYHIIWLGLRLN
jgi:hypothetical protein